MKDMAEDEGGFSKLLDGDICFKIGEEQIYAHRLILATRCAYFQQMLNTRWANKVLLFPFSLVSISLFLFLLFIYIYFSLYSPKGDSCIWE